MNTRSIRSICSTLAAMLIGVPAFAQDNSTRWTICTTELELIETALVSGDEQRIIGIDGLGLRRVYAIDELFFVASMGRHDPASLYDLDTVAAPSDIPLRFVTLTDGQVLSGQIGEPAQQDSLSLGIRTGSIMRGDASISLERVRSITDAPERDWNAPIGEDDTVIMHNGDELSGFIESIGPTIKLSIERDVRVLDLAQIESLSLANPSEVSAGVYLSGIDGLRVRALAFDFDFEHPITVRVDRASIGLDDDARDLWLLEPNALGEIEVVHETRRVVALVEIEPELIEPTGDRGWTPTPTVLSSPINPVLSTIDLHAPVRVLYRVPEGSTRFACELVAPINTYTDCIASVYSISYSGLRTELLTQRLNLDHPSQILDAFLEPETEKIEIRIDPGVNGPIQDRVLVVHPRLLVETS